MQEMEKNDKIEKYLNLEIDNSELKENNPVNQDEQDMKNFIHYLEDEEVLKIMWEKCKNWFQEEDSSKSRELKMSKKEVEDLRKKNRALEIENQRIYQLKNKIDKLENDYKYLQRLNSDNERTIANLKNQQNADLTKITEQNREIRNLENEKAQFIRVIEQNRQEMQNLKDKLSSLSSEYEVLKKTNDSYEKQFKTPIALYEKYLRLSENTKSSIKNILNQESVEKFIFTGVQEDNFISLWEYMRNQTINGNDIQELFSIFSYFLNAFNANYESPIYALNQTHIGEEFDNDYHITGYKSSVAGTIKKIDLLGFYNLRTGKIIKKTVVKI